MTKDLVSARREPSRADTYAWVWITPLEGPRYRVCVVEVPRHLIDDDICFYEPDIVRTVVDTVPTIERAEEVVRGLGVDPDDLDAPWHNGFPL